MAIGRYGFQSVSYITARNTLRESRDIVFKIAYLSLQAVDLALTLLAANLGFPELNPIIGASLDSPFQLVIFKVGIPLLIALLIPGKLLIPAIVLLAAVVGWDLKELLLLWL